MSTRTHSVCASERFFVEGRHPDLATTARRIFDVVLAFVDRAVPPTPASERRLPANDARLSTTFNAARALRQLRVHARLTQKEFAGLLGVAESRLVLIEIGEAGCLETLQTCKRARAILENSHETSAAGGSASGRRTDANARVEMQEFVGSDNREAP
jgi:DNA-binding XRE family transcriptional regulator